MLTCKDSLGQDLGNLYGHVMNPDSLPVEEAIVSLERTDQLVYTDKRGNFSVQNLEVATFTLSINARGYVKQRVSVSITPGQADFIIIYLKREEENNQQ